MISFYGNFNYQMVSYSDTQSLYVVIDILDLATFSIATYTMCVGIEPAFFISGGGGN